MPRATIIPLGLALTFLTGFSELGRVFGTRVEEMLLLILLAAIVSALWVSSRYYRGYSALVSSMGLSIGSVGLIAVAVYYGGIAVGNQPPGWVEGKGIAVGYGFWSLVSALLATLALLIAIRCSFIPAYKQVSGRRAALLAAIAALLIILLPIAIVVVSMEYGLSLHVTFEPLIWFGYIYKIADWSRSVNQF